MKHHDEALDQYERALTVFREMGDRHKLGATLDNIGTVLTAQKRYKAALSSLEKALEIRREVCDLAGEGTKLENMGFVHQEQGHYGMRACTTELSGCTTTKARMKKPSLPASGTEPVPSLIR